MSDPMGLWIGVGVIVIVALLYWVWDESRG